MNENLTPIITLPPGYAIKEELKARRIRQKDFAAQIEMQPSHLSEIINGSRAINEQIAEKLEQSLGIPVMYWLKDQARYDCAKKELEQLSIDEKEAEISYTEYDRTCDMKTLLKRLKQNCCSRIQQIQFCKDELGFASPAIMQVQFEKYSFGRYHKSEKTGLDKRMINTWSILARYSVKGLPVIGSFNRNLTDELSSDLRVIFHKNENTEQKVSNVLSKYGIRFCIVPKVDKASIDGYAFYCADGIPAIVVTQRISRIDNFAFAVLHEVGHLALHDIEDFPILSLSEEIDEDFREDEANKYAANALIPEEIWRKAPDVPINQYVIQNRYTKWAKENNLNKWIVLGRISHETGMYKFKSDKSREIN